MIDDQLNQEIIQNEQVVNIEQGSSNRQQILKSAIFVMLGNLGSSILGLIRQSVLAGLGPDITGPFSTALTPLQTFLDLLANGTVSGALIPTFTDYSAEAKNQELRIIVFSIINLLIIVTFIITVTFLFISPWFVGNILAGNFTPDQKILTIEFSQIFMFALMLMGPFAVLQAVLYSRREFGLPALASGLLHVGIIIGAILSGLRFGSPGLAAGVIVGAFAQILLLLPGLKKQKMRYMFVLDIKHPAIKRMLKLYAPLALSYIVSMFFVFLDLGLANRTPGNSAANLTALKLATTLIQFPGGLVSAALSFAVLPLLSKYATDKDDDKFNETLMMGIRLGLLLMIPAAAGLIVLRNPITSLLFEHRHYTPQDTALTAVALQNYAYQLPFIVIDQLVMFAFYARKNTIVPVLVGFVCYGLYAIVALPFYRTVGMPALALANTVQNSMHGIILLALFYKFFGLLSFRKTLPVLLKIIISTIAMVAIAWVLQLIMNQYAVFSLRTLNGQLLTTLIATSAAIAVYFGGIYILKVEEITLLKQAILAKLTK